MAQQKFYYVIEHETGIVRAAQSTLANAMTYTTPQNCHLFIIAGPMTADELHMGRFTNSPKPQIDARISESR
jgi:hypothetical protein